MIRLSTNYDAKIIHKIVEEPVELGKVSLVTKGVPRPNSIEGGGASGPIKPGPFAL
jgi:hypothetical protein